MRLPCGVTLLTALACASLAVGCGDGRPERAVERTRVTGEARDTGSMDPSAAFLPPGEVSVSLDGGGLTTVRAAEAPRGAIVAAIAERAEFSVMIGDEARLDERLTVQASREPMEVVLARVLAGVPHALEYEPDVGSGPRRLVLVTVGQTATPAAGMAAGSSSDDAPAKTRQHRATSPGGKEERAERARRLWAKSLEDLESTDPELRADGARWLDVSSSEGFEAAVDHLASDQSAEVRIAAAESLIDADAGAVQPLVQALGDRDPQVIMAALEALEFVGDEATVPQLRLLLSHKDPKVRERTLEAIEFLE